MDGIDIVGGGLDNVVVAFSGSNGISPAETTLEVLLGTEDSILLYPLRREVYVNDNGEQREVHLTPAEFNLLEYLMRNAGRAVQHSEISTKVLGYDVHDKGLYHSIAFHIQNLRKKLGQEHIRNIYGVGYKFIGAQKHATDEVPLESEESLLLHPSSREVYVNDDGKSREIHLGPIEFNLLEYFMKNAGRVVPYDEISTKVLGYDGYGGDLQHLTRVHISRLRKKIGDNPSNPRFIETIHGFGYKFIGAQNNR